MSLRWLALGVGCCLPACGDKSWDEIDYGFGFTDTVLWQEFTPTSARLETLKVFLLVGQSNMAGLNPISPG